MLWLIFGNAPVPEHAGKRAQNGREVLASGYILLRAARIRSDAKLNTVRCAARTSREITLLICSSTAVTEAIMAYRWAPLVGHWPLLRLVDLLRC